MANLRGDSATTRVHALASVRVYTETQNREGQLDALELLGIAACPNAPADALLLLEVTARYRGEHDADAATAVSHAQCEEARLSARRRLTPARRRALTAYAAAHSVDDVVRRLLFESGGHLTDAPMANVP